MTIPSSVVTDTRAILSCKLNDANALSTVLKALNPTLSSNEAGVFAISQDGIKLITDHARVLQCHAYLPRSLFQTFSFSPNTSGHASDTQSTSWDPDSSISRNDRDEDDNRGATRNASISCSIQFSTLMECLNVFGGQKSKTAVKIEWKGYGEKLHVLLEDDSGVMTSCLLTTFETDVIGGVDFLAVPTTSKLIMRSEWLKAAFAEMDTTNEKLTIRIAPTEPYCTLTATGNAGSMEMVYSKDDTVIEFFMCPQLVEYSYPFQFASSLMKPLGLSSKTSLRTNADGFLSAQFMIPIQATQAAPESIVFVDYVFAPLEEAE